MVVQSKPKKDPVAMAEDQLEGIKQHLADMRPSAIRQENIRRTLVRVEDEIEDLQKEIEHYEQKKNGRSTGRRRTSVQRKSALAPVPESEGKA